MIALIVRFTVLPDHLDAFDALVSDVIEQIDLHEPGTLVYLSHQRADNPTSACSMSATRAKKPFRLTRTRTTSRDFLDDLRKHLAQPPEIWRMSTLEGLIRGEAPPRSQSSPTTQTVSLPLSPPPAMNYRSQTDHGPWGVVLSQNIPANHIGVEARHRGVRLQRHWRLAVQSAVDSNDKKVELFGCIPLRTGASRGLWDSENEFRSALPRKGREMPQFMDYHDDLKLPDDAVGEIARDAVGITKQMCSELSG